MEIDISTIQNGTWDGRHVWVCHYNRPDLQKKPLRNLPPTKVLVVSNDDLPDNKTVYYSQSHFRPFNKKGVPKAQIISPVDNTGFRSRQGNPVHVFDNEQDCIDSWNDQIDEHIIQVDIRIENAANYWISEKAKLTGMIKDK